ncbi:MAG: glycosyltransferase, partial [Planctomycetota bacterium]
VNRYPQARYILEETLGLSYARNTGVRAARGDIIAFIDDDAEASPGWLEALLEIYDSIPEAWAVGGKVLPIWDAAKPEWLTERYYRSLSLVEWGQSARPLHWPERIIGTNCSFRRRVFTEIGLFDTSLGRLGSALLGEEDREIQQRIHGLGHLVYYTPRAIVHHHVPASRMTREYFDQRSKGTLVCEEIMALRSQGKHEQAAQLSNRLREKAMRCYIIPTQQTALAESNLRLAQFRDKHRGQRCVIIGNGPSLNKMDLSFLKNEITFGMNRIYLLFNKWDFRPTYYVSVNPLVIEQSAGEIYKITSPKFLSLNGLPHVQNHRDNIFLQSIRRPSFSTDPRNGLWEGHTVTYVAMQLAYFMGFSEVILIGVDHCFKTKGAPNKEIVSQGPDENHFHPDYFGKGVRWQLPDLERSEMAYRLAKQAFEAAGRQIIDATVDGHLTIFPKADYREIFFPPAHTVKSVKAGLSAELIDTEFEDYFRNRSEFTEPLVTKASAKFAPAHPVEQQQRYLVSAIVSTYNSERFLRGCLEDLENQTIADRLEIIVVNSGSQQNEETIVKEFQQNYDNIVYIRTEQREEIYTAWNRAVRAAHGQFLTNANTDDRHREDALEIMAKTLQSSPDVALVYGDQICTDTPNGTFAAHHAAEMAKRPDYSRQRLLFGCCVGSQPMWRRSLHNEIGYFDETLTSAGDWDFWLRISNKHPFKHIPEFLGLYYYNEHGIEHGRKIHSLYERYIVGRRHGNPYISVIPVYHSKDNPLVSVIMPAYNAAEYIAEAIESVLIQNHRNFELIIVDDGSTDNTKDIVAGFKNDKIKYFYKQNAGPSSARNLAIKRAKGQYIMPLDSDDMMTPDFIARHLQEFEKHPEADLVYSDVLLIDVGSNPIRVMKKPEYQDRRHMIRDLLRAGHPIVPFRLGIRKSVFDKIGFYDEKLMVAEDYDMMRRFVKHGLKAHHLPGALHMRRMTSSSLSRNFSLENAKSHFDVVKRFMDTFRYDELFPDVAWERIPAEHRQSHAKCLAAVTFLGVGQAYVKTNSVNYARTAFDLACSELNSCLERDPGNMRVRQLLEKSELARSRCSESVPQAAR